MCTDTKGRIAEAVEQMLQTRPVCKITVQRVMEQAQMKRQSFYYHYQDIYSVLEWIVETELCAPLQYDGAQAPGEWCLQALTLLREKRRSTTPQSSEAVTGLNEERPLLSRWTRPKRPSDIQRSFLSGAGGGARTRTVVTPRDFKSLVSAIPPHRQMGIF